MAECLRRARRGPAPGATGSCPSLFVPGRGKGPAAYRTAGASGSSPTALAASREQLGKVEQRLSELQHRTALAQTELQAKDRQLAALRENLQRDEAIREREKSLFEEDLARCGYVCPIPEEVPGWLAQRDQEWQRYQTAVKDLEQARHKLLELQHAQDGVRRKLEDWTGQEQQLLQELSQIRTNLEEALAKRRALFGEKSVTEERQAMRRLVEEREASLGAAQQALDSCVQYVQQLLG